MPGQHGSARALQQLPPALQLHILSLLPPNDRALSGRLVSPDAADGLGVTEDCTASLSQPLPPHALAWASASCWQEHVRQLPFLHKLQLLCAAARSGSEVNLEVALALLQPSIFPELLKRTGCSAWRYHDSVHCPGEAVAKAGHPQLLPWLVRRCPWLVWPTRALRAAAQHSDLAGLQVAWEALQHGFCSSSSGLFPDLIQEMLDGAAESSTPDAVPKMEWVLATAVHVAGEGGKAEVSPCGRLQLTTAAAAARSGDLGRLRWLRDRGCPIGRGSGWELDLDELDVLAVALQHADLAVAQWLVSEGGCELPEPGEGEEDGDWFGLLHASAGSGVDAAAKLLWLRELGAPQLDYHGLVLQLLARAALTAGQVEVLQLLPGLWEPEGLPYLRKAMSDAASHGLPTRWSVPLASYMQQSGWVFSHEEYVSVSRSGHAGTVAWLAREAGVSAAGLDLCRFVEAWPVGTPSDSRGLLEAVQVLVGEAGWRVPDMGAKRLLLTAAQRGEMGLVQYLLEELGQQLEQEQQHHQQQELEEVQPMGQQHHGEGEEQQEDLWRVGHLSESFKILAAARSGCEALLELVVGQMAGMPNLWFSSPYIEPAKRGDRGTLEALRRLGVPWGAEDVVAEAVKEGCAGPGLRWLVEHGGRGDSTEDVEKVP